MDGEFLFTQTTCYADLLATFFSIPRRGKQFYKTRTEIKKLKTSKVLNFVGLLLVKVRAG